MNEAASPPAHTIWRRVRPWMRDEFMTVDGRQVVYSTDSPMDQTIVHLHGGASMSVEVLLSTGHTVVMPRIVRLDRS